MPLAADVDWEALAEQCRGYVGADLAALCREAALLALREEAKGEGGGLSWRRTRGVSVLSGSRRVIASLGTQVGLGQARAEGSWSSPKFWALRNASGQDLAGDGGFPDEESDSESSTLSVAGGEGGPSVEGCSSGRVHLGQTLRGEEGRGWRTWEKREREARREE